MTYASLLKSLVVTTCSNRTPPADWNALERNLYELDVEIASKFTSGLNAAHNGERSHVQRMKREISALITKRYTRTAWSCLLYTSDAADE